VIEATLHSAALHLLLCISGSDLPPSTPSGWRGKPKHRKVALFLIFNLMYYYKILLLQENLLINKPYNPNQSHLQ
jgi:hypothetical protein